MELSLHDRGGWAHSNPRRNSVLRAVSTFSMKPFWKGRPWSSWRGVKDAFRAKGTILSCTSCVHTDWFELCTRRWVRAVQVQAGPLLRVWGSMKRGPAPTSSARHACPFSSWTLRFLGFTGHSTSSQLLPEIRANGSIHSCLGAPLVAGFLPRATRGPRCSGEGSPGLDHELCRLAAVCVVAELFLEGSGARGPSVRAVVSPAQG